MTVCEHFSQRSTCPPSAAVRQRSIADMIYADWAHPVGDAFSNVRAYRDRLNARPSVARTIDEARPYRHFFPLGAPDRD